MANSKDLNHELRMLVHIIKGVSPNEYYEDPALLKETRQLFKVAGTELFQLLPAGKICDSCKGSGVAMD